MAFAENLKRLRKERELTQAALAQKAGVSISSIINYEGKRRTDPPGSIVARLAQALDVPREELDDGCTIELSRSAEAMMRRISEPPKSDMVSMMEDFVQRDGERVLLEDFRLLNFTGKLEAIKRMCELAQLAKYKIGEDGNAEKSNDAGGAR